MAQIYDALGRTERAAELRAKAGVLVAKFNETFWNEADGFYAYTLDGDKKPVWSVASNPGNVSGRESCRLTERVGSPTG